MPRIAYYETNLQDFLAADEDAILGALTMQHGFALEHQQKHAWQGQIQLLQRLLSPTLKGWIYFEFSIPRMGKRAYQETRSRELALRATVARLQAELVGGEPRLLFAEARPLWDNRSPRKLIW